MQVRMWPSVWKGSLAYLGTKRRRQKCISNGAAGQASQSATLAVHWTGTSHFTHHHSHFAAATPHSQSTSTTHKMKYLSVVFLWKTRTRDFGFHCLTLQWGELGKEGVVSSGLALTSHTRGTFYTQLSARTGIGI